MKKSYLSPILILSFLLAGCSTSFNQCATDPEVVRQLYSDLEQAARTNPEVEMIPGVGIGDVHFGMTKTEVEDRLGKPYRITDSVYEYQLLGIAVVFDRGNRVFALYAGGWCEASDILTDVFKGVTPEGIKMRSTKQEVADAYGTPDKVRDLSANELTFETWKYEDLRVQFAFRDDLLVHITMLTKATD